MPGSRESVDNRKYLFVFFGFAVISLFVRLLLLNWYSSPYTDGVFLLTLFESFNSNNSYPPLYSGLLSSLNFFLKNPILCGRLISAFSGVGVILLLFKFAKKLFNTKTAFYAALIYGSAPILFRWDLRVMTDSLFNLFFLAAIFFLYECLTSPDKLSFILFNLCAALSALTRYQGLSLIPVSLYCLYRTRYHKQPSLNLSSVISGLSFWAVIPLWMIWRGFSHTAHYQEFLTQSGSVWLTLGKFITVSEMFIPALIYAFGYLAFAFMIYGFMSYLKNQSGPSEFLLSLGFLFLAFWLAHSAFLVAFQTRYFLVFWPIAALFAALGLFNYSQNHPKLANGLLVFILFSNVFWSGMVLYFQKDSFGSLKRCAEFVKKNLPQEQIFTAEDFKFTYFANRFIKGESFVKRHRIFALGNYAPPVGSYVYINSVYTKNFNDYLNNNKYRIVYTDSENMVPILPDIGLLRYTNSPDWLAARFRPQKIYSALLKVVA